jgi:GT2 family glycosyltransferase
LTGAERRAREQPDVSVVVLAYNHRELIGPCLDSLTPALGAGRRHEVIVIDNGSRDGTAELVRTRWPDVRLIVNPDNLGLTRGRNQGIEASRGRHVLFLDSDARLRPGCLDTLLARMEADPGAGAAGPRLVYGDGRWQRWTAGREPSLRSAANYLLFLERVFPGRRRFAGMFLTEDVSVPFQPDWVSGACLLIRRQVFDEVGLFPVDVPPGYYMDDVDMCRRIRESGRAVWYCSDAEAVHLMHASWRGSASRAPIRSLNHYFAGRRSLLATLALRGLEVVGFGARALAYLGAFSWSRQPHLRTMARVHWTSCVAGLENVPNHG